VKAPASFEVIASVVLHVSTCAKFDTSNEVYFVVHAPNVLNCLERGCRFLVSGFGAGCIQM